MPANQRKQNIPLPRSLNCEDEPSRKLYEQVRDLAMQGMGAKSIAEVIGISPKAVGWRINRLVVTGVIPRLKQRKEIARQREAELQAKLMTADRTDSLSSLVDLLTPSEMGWMFDNMPAGAKLVDFFAMLIRDAYADENDQSDDRRQG